MTPADPSRPPFKILIIDDEPSIVHVLARTLLGMGMLRFAVRGEDALRVLAEDPQDLVLTDADMPDISGFEIIERMRQDPRMAGTPVIMITGHAAPQIREHAQELGVSEFMVKPIDRDQLKATVQRLLGGPVAVATPEPVAAPADPVPAPPAPPESPAPSGVASMLLDRVAGILEEIDTLRASGAQPDPQRLATSLTNIEDACGDMTRLIIQLNDRA
jgi:CheY-like chemotaxis protein